MSYGSITITGDLDEQSNGKWIGTRGILKIYFQNLKCFPQHIRFQIYDTLKTHFLKSEWEDKEGLSLKYLIYRFGYFLLCYGILFQNLVCLHDPLFFIYLTNWNLTLQLTYATMYFFHLLTHWISSRINCGKLQMKKNPKVNDFMMEKNTKPSDLILEINHKSIGFIREKRKMNEIQAIEMTIWILFNIIGATSIGVTFGYWLVVSDYDEDTTSCTFVSTVMVHGINAVLAIVDILIVGIPIKPAHLIFPSLVGAIYGFFSVLYEVSGGIYYAEGEPYIYSILNWREKPGFAFINCLLGVSFGVFFHFTYWFLYQLRLFLVKKFKSVEGYKQVEVNIELCNI